MLEAGPRLTENENNLKKNNTSMGKKWDKVDAFESSPEKFPSSAIEFIILFVLMHCWIAWIMLTVHMQIELQFVHLDRFAPTNQLDYPNLPSRPLGM